MNIYRYLREKNEVGHPTPELKPMPIDHEQIETPFTEEELNHIAHIHRRHGGRHLDRIEELKAHEQDTGANVGSLIHKHMRASWAHHEVCLEVRNKLRQMGLSQKRYGKLLKTTSASKAPVSTKIRDKLGGENMKILSDQAFKYSRKAIKAEQEHGIGDENKRIT